MERIEPVGPWSSGPGRIERSQPPQRIGPDRRDPGGRDGAAGSRDTDKEQEERADDGDDDDGLEHVDVTA